MVDQSAGPDQRSHRDSIQKPSEVIPKTLDGADTSVIEVETDKQEKKKSQKRNVTRMLFIGLVAAAIITIALGVGLGVGLRNGKSKKRAQSNEDTADVYLLPDPTNITPTELADMTDDAKRWYSAYDDQVSVTYDAISKFVDGAALVLPKTLSEKDANHLKSTAYSLLIYMRAQNGSLDLAITALKNIAAGQDPFQTSSWTSLFKSLKALKQQLRAALNVTAVYEWIKAADEQHEALQIITSRTTVASAQAALAEADTAMDKPDGDWPFDPIPDSYEGAEYSLEANSVNDPLMADNSTDAAGDTATNSTDGTNARRRRSLKSGGRGGGARGGSDPMAGGQASRIRPHHHHPHHGHDHHRHHHYHHHQQHEFQHAGSDQGQDHDEAPDQITQRRLAAVSPSPATKAAAPKASAAAVDPKTAIVIKSTFKGLVIPITFHALQYKDSKGRVLPPTNWKGLGPIISLINNLNLVHLKFKTGFQFTLDEYRTDVKKYPYLNLGTFVKWQDCSMKGPDCIDNIAATYSTDPSKYVNIFSSGSRMMGGCDKCPFGFAYTPYEDSEADYAQGYVWMLWDRVDPTAENNAKSFGAGIGTIIHEVGHWLGLEHTHEGGCDDLDGVSDTTANANGLFQPWYQDLQDYCTALVTKKKPRPPASTTKKFDSCPLKPGIDNIYNYLSYNPAPCRNAFTRQQVKRMQALTAKFRPKMFKLYRYPPAVAATKKAATKG